MGDTLRLYYRRPLFCGFHLGDVYLDLSAGSTCPSINGKPVRFSDGEGRHFWRRLLDSVNALQQIAPVYTGGVRRTVGKHVQEHPRVASILLKPRERCIYRVLRRKSGWNFMIKGSVAAPKLKQ